MEPVDTCFAVSTGLKEPHEHMGENKVMQPILLALLMGSFAVGEVMAQPFGDDAAIDPFENDEVLLPGAPPSTPGNLRFGGEGVSAESEIRLLWNGGSGADGFRVYRRDQQIAIDELLFGPIDSDAGASSLDWREVGHTQEKEWRDAVAPPDPEGSGYQLLHVGPYCYMVEAYNGAGSTESETVCRRIRDVNKPRDGTLAEATPTSLALTWIDTSNLEWGFRISYRRADDPPEMRRYVILPTEDAQRHVLSGLQSNTDYCASVQAVSYYERSDWASIETGVLHCALRTLPDPDPEPDQPVEKTVDVFLQREMVWDGPTPYVAVYPAFGAIHGGVVTRISSHPWAPSSLLFVKPNFTTDDCANPSAVVVLELDGTLDAGNLAEIYNDSTPNLPIRLVACSGPFFPVPNQIPIKLTYRIED